jgi:hypothetical protein
MYSSALVFYIRASAYILQNITVLTELRTCHPRSTVTPQGKRLLQIDNDSPCMKVLERLSRALARECSRLQDKITDDVGRARWLGF